MMMASKTTMARALSRSTSVTAFARSVVPVVEHGARARAKTERCSCRAVILVVLWSGVPKEGAEDGDSDEHRDVVAQQDEPEGDAVAKESGHSYRP